jgi:uncharacterized protein
MKFQLEAPGGVNLIRGYVPGELRVNEATYATGIVLSAATIVAPWRPTAIAELQEVDLEPILALQPEVVLLGTGARQVFPDPAMLRALYARNVGIEIMDTSAACRTFNVLVAEGRAVVAALIV